MSDEHDRGALFVSDAELIRWFGIGEKKGRQALATLDKELTFPKRDPLFSGKRYRPAVKAYLDRRSGLTIGSAGAVPAFPLDDGVENFDD